MHTQTETTFYSLQAYSPDPEALYSVDVAASLAGMPRHEVLVCCRRGIVTPYIDPDFGGFSFDLGMIRTLQHIEYLRSVRGVNFAGIEIILPLLAEIREVRAQSRF